MQRKRLRCMTLGRAVLAAVVPTALLTILDVPAAKADPWDLLDLFEPANDKPGYRAPSMKRYERASDREEGGYWRRREPASATWMPSVIHFPGLPRPPQLRSRRTKQGRLTLEELQLVSDPGGGLHGRRPGYDFQITADGGIVFSDRPAIQVEAFYLLGIVGTFDVTDWLMRRIGDDPYRYDKDQVRILTSDLRADLERLHRKAVTSQASVELER
jgi:hypothetical protein